MAEGLAAGKVVSVMVSGEAFSLAMQLNSSHGEAFKKKVLLRVNSVILFRSSPKQKAECVKLVKNEFGGKKTTLAIGDGFNDVNMI